MAVKNRNAVVRSKDYEKSMMYCMQLACLSMIREEGLITDNEEYLYRRKQKWLK